MDEFRQLETLDMMSIRQSLQRHRDVSNFKHLPFERDIKYEIVNTAVEYGPNAHCHIFANGESFLTPKVMLS